MRLLLGIACLVTCALPARAVDLTKIERRIAKEPAYQGKPKYCLLVFGPNAELRVWLVADGKTLYVDRNGNGDLTEANERVAPHYFPNGQFSFRPGKVGSNGIEYNLHQVGEYAEGCELSASLPNRRGFAMAGFDGPGRLVFANSADKAPIVHFFGPLTFQRFEPQPGAICPHLKPLPLLRGSVDHLSFSVGTPGLGNGTFVKQNVSFGASVRVDPGDGKRFDIALTADG